MDCPVGTPESVIVRLREAAPAAAVDPRFVTAPATVETHSRPRHGCRR
jgi:hypothetical protein